MRKTTKKSPPKASRKKVVKDLEVRPAKGGTVRGGDKGRASVGELQISKVVDKSSAVLF